MKISKFIIYAIAFAFVFSTAAFGAEVRESEAMGVGFDQSYRASDLMNKDIHNSKGEKIGEVTDLVIDDSGQVQQIVIGGIDGLVVPFDSSEFAIRDDAIVAYNLDAETFAGTGTDFEVEDSGVRGYYGEDASVSPDDRFIAEEDARPLGYPLDRHPQLDVWHPPAGHPPYGAAD
jgi:sporulation protein YlmC with PRC-barrel domain